VFWLSHHPPEQFNRCYQVGGLRLCARCLGTYPVLFALVAAQLALGTPLAHPFDWVAVLLVLPATLDWAFGQFRPQRFSNPWRTATGVLFGMGLARSLYIHLRSPFPVVLNLQLGLVTLVALPVILATYSLSRRR
jgi:uncharacterized membrane protein